MRNLLVSVMTSPLWDEGPLDEAFTSDRDDGGRGDDDRPDRPASSVTIDDLATRLEQCWAMLEEGSLSGHDVKRVILSVVDTAIADDVTDASVLVDYALAIADAVADDVRYAAPTLGGSVRAHLDHRLASARERAALNEQLAVVEAGLSFGLDEQAQELTELCRTGRRDNVVLLGSGEAASSVVALAVRYDCVTALEATVRPGFDAEWRLGWHLGAWTLAFDGLWQRDHRSAAVAQSVLVELLHQPSTCLDAAVRIHPAWLAADTEAMTSALLALDRHEAGLANLPQGVYPQGLATTIHALRSLLWLAQDATTSADNHRYWLHT